jgi:hypothetical protein
MLKDALLSKPNKAKRYNLSKYVSGKIKVFTKDKKNSLGMLFGDRNRVSVGKLRTNDYQQTAMSRFTKDSKLYKMPISGVPKMNDKNTSALLENYQKISESMTFDYSIDSHHSRGKLIKVDNGAINNFDPSWTKSYRK